MTALEFAPAPPSIDAPPRMVHLEHPNTPRTAWCGADVTGNYPPAGTEVDCIVCAELAFHDYLKGFKS